MSDEVRGVQRSGEIRESEGRSEEVRGNDMSGDSRKDRWEAQPMSKVGKCKIKRIILDVITAGVMGWLKIIKTGYRVQRTSGKIGASKRRHHQFTTPDDI